MLARVFCVLGLILCEAAIAQTRVMPFDKSHTELGFDLTTRWGQKLHGQFPSYDGTVTLLPDGRHEVSLRMYTADVQIADHTRYTQWARGSAFFDAGKWPEVVFTSQPYESDVLRSGGHISGELMIRGIHRPQVLTVQPAVCQRPAFDCDVVLSGEVSRSDYAMDSLKLAISDRVVFILHARLGSPLEEKKP